MLPSEETSCAEYSRRKSRWRLSGPMSMGRLRYQQSRVSRTRAVGAVQWGVGMTTNIDHQVSYAVPRAPLSPGWVRARGPAYFDRGAVEVADAGSEEIEAIVFGTQSYNVRIRVRGASPPPLSRVSCTC